MRRWNATRHHLTLPADDPTPAPHVYTYVGVRGRNVISCRMEQARTRAPQAECGNERGRRREEGLTCPTTRGVEGHSTL